MLELDLLIYSSKDLVSNPGGNCVSANSDEHVYHMYNTLFISLKSQFLILNNNSMILIKTL